MKKISLFLTLWCILTLSHSQTEHFEIEWNSSKVFYYGSNKIELPHFKAKNFNFSFEKGITFIAQLDDKKPVNLKSVKITNLITTVVRKSDLKDLKLSWIANDVELRTFNSNARGSASNTIEINPIYNDNGVIKKILSFTLSYSSSHDNKLSSSSTSLQSSVLKTGQWYRFAVDTTGVHKLDKGFFDALGINTDNINPKKIKVYGHGGQSLPLTNNETQSYDLIQNAVQFFGEEDGVFNSEDFLLFYAIGPKYYNAENNSHINPYSDVCYYYIEIGNENGLRMSAANQPLGNPSNSFNTFHDYKFFEKDEYNIGQIGRRWFGHRFYFENTRSFNFDFPNLITSSPLKLKVYVAASAESITNMEIKANNSDVSNLSLPSVDYGILGTEAVFNGDIESSSDTVTIDLVYNNNGNPSARAYLDYISLEAERALVANALQFQFKHNDMPFLSGVGQFNISNATGIDEVWDVTDPYNTTYYKNVLNSTEFSFKTNLGSSRIYQAVALSNTFRPRLLTNASVANQDLKGTIFLNSEGQFQDIDYLIITPEFLSAQSERLANINRLKNNLTVKVVTLKSIYSEFSTGMQDISAIRNLVKYVYDNASNPNKRLKYLCLFGDASFDYKDRIQNNTNIVPSWLSKNSFSLTSSFISDDFFGMMDPFEGSMVTGDKLDIAVGRILAESPQRADEMVNKIESYYNLDAYANWRNNFLLISDDVDKLSDRFLQITTDQIAEDVKASKPFINVEKIHSDSFTQESSAAGQRYPQVNDAIFNALEVGAVVVNYFGHGGEDGLASERIFDKINAKELNNPNKLACFVTVTCEYTKFDNPLRKTAGEFLYWNKNGGAIGLISTTRQIFISVGIQFNQALSQYLFDFENSQTMSIAEALRLTKNDPSVTNNSQRRLVFFIGDPALKLPLAAPDIIATKLNGEDISNTNITLQALSPAKIEGFVASEQGNILSNYSGTLTATVFDKSIQRSTLANDGSTFNGQLITLDFEALGEVLFRGQASVENGKFEINFIVPRDIVIPIGNGKISFYSKTETPLSDQRGYNFDIQIGGVNLNAPVDNQGPNIDLYINDESFVSGGITNENPTLIAKLYDENGINTASGVGHDIVAILDGDETNPFVLNDYYTADLDSYQRGSLSYPFRNIEAGIHTLSLKAWDVYNNSSTKEIQFIVFDQNESLEITNILNYPNPFINYTEFWFNHNSSGVLDVSIQIFTISGKLIKTINSQTNASGSTSSLSRDISWDGTDDFGSKIGKGVYIYKLNVKSQLTGLKSEKIEKLVIL